jgi:L-amino acid N-acyltransferase YncA
MSFRLIRTSPAMADEGFDLFARRYEQASRARAPVPPLAQDQRDRLRARVGRAFAVGGVAAVRDGRMVGYLIASPIFDMRGQPATLIPEHGHAVAPGEEATLYGPLYAGAIEERVRDGAQLHLIGRFDGDDATGRALEDLGFGAVVDERLRELDDVPGAGEGDPGLVVEGLPPDVRWDEVAEIAAEHAAYYRSSPIFLAKDLGIEAAREDLEAHRQAGDRLFVARVGGTIVAYLIVGACVGRTEGRLLADTRTAQVRSAYARPASRRRGFGSALLQRAVAWARDAGYERLFVEHETANLEGRAFWRRHFAPFLRFSMRYVQRTP